MTTGRINQVTTAVDPRPRAPVARRRLPGKRQAARKARGRGAHPEPRRAARPSRPSALEAGGLEGCGPDVGAVVVSNVSVVFLGSKHVVLAVAPSASSAGPGPPPEWRRSRAGATGGSAPGRACSVCQVFPRSF